MTDAIDLVVNAIFTGLGTGIGSYLANKYAITHLEKNKDMIKENVTKIKRDLFSDNKGEP